MKQKEKKIPSYTIEVHKDKKSGKLKKAIISREKEGEPWYRDALDRKKDGLLVPEIMQDIRRVGINLSNLNEKGKRVGKYPNLFMINLPANPKSSKRSRKKYVSYLKKYIEKKGYDKNFAKFLNKRVLIYIIVYLRKKRYELGNDVDNFAKPILDSLKEYMGDDSKIDTLIIEKKLLTNYDERDLDFLEQVTIAITNPEAKVDILKNV